MSSNYYNMLDSTGASGFLPTVTFDGSSGICTSLHRINKLNNIGITGFYEADFANTVTAIDLSAFAFDTKVVVATINGVTSIRSDAFYGCTALRSITLDCSVNTSTKKYLLTDISSGAFQGCFSLRNVHIPDTVKIIPDNMCNGCTNLEVAVMGYGWDRTGDTYNRSGAIGQYAFANCSRLSYFVVPETVANIYDYAFQNDPSLALVYILGRPDVSLNVFSGTTMNSATATYYYDMSKNNLTSFATDISSALPSLATRRIYREFTLTATGQLTPATVRSTIPATTYWKGKIMNAVTSLADSCFAGNSGGADVKYPYMIGLSFPPALTSIGYAAFSNNDGTSGYASIVGAFYIPNSVSTFGTNATFPTISNTFNYFNTTLRDTSTTRQIVFQSGANTFALSTQMFYCISARAIIAPTATTVWNACFQYAQYIQLFSFFQKNAYTSLTKLDYITDDGAPNAFGNSFNAGSGITQYLYIPKQITRIATSAFLAITNSLIITVYCSTTDGGSTGLCNTADFLAIGRFSGTAPTFHIINNYYDATQLTLGTLKPSTGNYHVLFPSGVKTISNRFASSTTLKTASFSDTVTDISGSAFTGCTGLTRLNISPSSNLTNVGASAFLNCTALTTVFIPNSLRGINTSTFSGCTSLASVTYGNNPGIKYIGNLAFFDTTSTLASIFIPSSVVFIGNRVFITSSLTNQLKIVTFGAGSRLKSIDYKCFGGEGPNVQFAAQLLRDLVLPSSLCYMGSIANTATTASPLQNTHRLAHSANLIVPSLVEVIPWAFLYADTGTVDISNVYFPRSITNIAGPRKHNGYSVNYLGTSTSFAGAEFYESKTGSLIYLPSELSAYTGVAGSYPFPNYIGTSRTRSFYRTVSFTTNPLISLNLSGTVANTTNAATTTQIHANIKEGVIVIGNGTTSIDMSGAIDGSSNLISVNIPSTVTDICANAFNGCSALAYVTFSENSHLTTIGNSAFSGCTMIHDIKLPDTVTTIGQNAFNGCYNLASISIPYNVTSIGAGAFNIINNNSPTTYIARPATYLAYQLGGDIDGEAAGDYSGYSVSLSSDGKILAIGAYLNNATGTEAGHARVYKYQTITNTTWSNYTVNSFSNTGTSPYDKPIVVNGGDANPVANKYYWVQLGGDFDGEVSYDRSGAHLSLSSDGTTIAIGAFFNDGTANNAGHVRVYKYDSAKTTRVTDQTSNDFGPIGWRRLGKDIDGEASSDNSGLSVSLSVDGTTVAIGASYNDGTPVGADRGHVRVYKYDVTKTTLVTDQSSNDFGPISWRRLGQDIDGEAASDFSGDSVSLSSDGTTVAIGAYGNDGTASAAGHVRVYKYDLTKTTLVTDQSSNDFGPIGWRRLGRDIDGEALGDYAGTVSLSADGTIVAIGAYRNDGTGNSAGHVRVYKYDVTKTTLVTDQSSNDFGPIGWRRLGQDIDGEAADDQSGISVSLSSDGTIVAIGADLNDGTASAAGHVRVYKYDSAKTTNVTDQTSNDFGPIGWRRLCKDIDGEVGDDRSGESVSISADGTTVAIGAYLNDGNGSNAGHVRVYQINQVTVPIRLHQKLYNDISGSFSAYFPGISPASVQVIPALQLTNTLNPAKLTISQINNMYIRYRQSQLGDCTFITVSASYGDGILRAIDITTALYGTAGLVHLDISTNVTSIDGEVCLNNSRIYSVAISKTVTSIGTSVFNGCTNLSYLSFHPDSVCTTIGVAAVHNTNIFDLALPDSLTTIGVDAFRSSIRLSSVCIPNNVTSLGLYAFYNCPKLTAVALPSSLALATYGTGTYFNINGSSTTGITFSSYSTSGAIAHFKLSDYSMPNGIVQNVVDSAVTYIDHRAYAYYPDITLYAVTTNKQTVTGGPCTYNTNGIQSPIMPATIWLNGLSVVSNSIFPIYRSVPDLNVFSLSNTTADWPDNGDDYYILMPGYSICIYNNLYDEENLFTDTPTFRYYDNEVGTVPLNINVTGVINTTSSILIMFAGRILTKYFLK